MIKKFEVEREILQLSNFFKRLHDTKLKELVFILIQT